MRWVLVVACLFALMPARAWDARGHKLVCEVAYEAVPDAVRTKVSALTDDLEEDFVSIGPWMDRVGPGPRHWISLPFAGNASSFSPTGANATNAEAACRNSIDLLRQKKGTAKDLGIVMHLVGDLHQPMHCVDRDRGGNTVPGNLHKFWDRGYRLGLRCPSFDDAVPGEGDIKSFVAGMAQPSGNADQGTPMSWAVETNKIARDCGYQPVHDGKLAPTEDDSVKARDVSQKQVVKAGKRLATLLKELFK